LLLLRLLSRLPALQKHLLLVGLPSLLCAELLFGLSLQKGDNSARVHSKLCPAAATQTWCWRHFSSQPGSFWVGGTGGWRPWFWLGRRLLAALCQHFGQVFFPIRRRRNFSIEESIFLLGTTSIGVQVGTNNVYIKKYKDFIILYF
jgi:hypothetical protein